MATASFPGVLLARSVTTLAISISEQPGGEVVGDHRESEWVCVCLGKSCPSVVRQGSHVYEVSTVPQDHKPIRLQYWMGLILTAYGGWRQRIWIMPPWNHVIHKSSPCLLSDYDFSWSVTVTSGAGITWIRHSTMSSLFEMNYFQFYSSQWTQSAYI